MRYKFVRVDRRTAMSDATHRKEKRVLETAERLQRTGVTRTRFYRTCEQFDRSRDVVGRVF